MATMSKSETARRGRTREKSGILYRYDGDFFDDRDGGVRRIKRDDPVRLVDRLDESARALPVDLDAAFVNHLPAGPLPGSGDPLTDVEVPCGDSWPSKACDRCGNVYWGQRACRRSQCPECWKSWDKERAIGISAKISGRQRYLNAGPGSTTWMHHAIVSPPQGYGMRSEQPLDRTKEAVKQIAGFGGADEGVIIYHPWRIAEAHRGDVLGHASGHGDKTWKDILGLIEELGFQEVADEYLVYGPHFHVIGLSEYFYFDTKGFEEESGWIVERISDDSGASIREVDDLCRVVGYSLSHAMLRGSGRGMDAAYWYFGEVQEFEPTPGVERDVERAFESIQRTILGIAPQPSTCSASAVDVDNERRSRGGGGGGGGGDPPDWLNLENRRERGAADQRGQETCGGRYIPMRRAPELLLDDEWRAGAPNADELADAYLVWRRKPPPDKPT